MLKKYGNLEFLEETKEKQLKKLNETIKEKRLKKIQEKNQK